MEDVAFKARVSPQTVSRALGRPELVAKETRRKVRDAVATLGYIPNEAARNLASNSSRIVAAIIPTLASSAYSVQVGQIVHVLEQRGISVIIGNSEYSQAREEALVRSLLERRPQGFILTGLEHTESTVQLIRSASVPVIETWDVDGPALDMAVGFSNKEAGRDVGRLFASRGANSVAFVGGCEEQDSRATSRYIGLSEGLAEAGIAKPYRVELDLPMNAQHGLVGLDRVLENAPMTDSILFSVDDIALAAMLECNRRGINVPNQLAICGFGDYDLAPLAMPSLTTVRISPEEMGLRSAQLLLDRIDGMTNSPQTITIQHQLIRRGSA